MTPTLAGPASTGSRRCAAAAGFLSAVLCLAAATGSAGAADIGLADQWRASSARPAELRRILVIGISRDAALRRQFEDRFVSLLRGRRSDGVPSYTLVPDLAAAADTAAVLDALFAREVDGVITVFLDPLDDRSHEAWAAGWRERVARETTVRAYVGEGLGAVTSDVTWIGVEFGLWSVQTGRLVWAGRTDGERMSRLRKQASDLVQAVINGLVYDKLLR
jgi:hypothetical protein